MKRSLLLSLLALGLLLVVTGCEADDDDADQLSPAIHGGGARSYHHCWFSGTKGHNAKPWCVHERRTRTIERARTPSQEVNASTGAAGSKSNHRAAPQDRAAATARGLLLRCWSVAANFFATDRIDDGPGMGLQARRPWRFVVGNPRGVYLLLLSRHS